MTDYWVSKLFFDLQQDAKLAAEYRTDMPGVLARYEIKPDIRKALLEDDVGKIVPLLSLIHRMKHGEQFLFQRCVRTLRADWDGQCSCYRE